MGTGRKLAVLAALALVGCGGSDEPSKPKPVKGTAAGAESSVRAYSRAYDAGDFPTVCRLTSEAGSVNYGTIASVAGSEAVDCAGQVAAVAERVPVKLGRVNDSLVNAKGNYARVTTTEGEWAVEFEGGRWKVLSVPQIEKAALKDG